MCRVLLTVFRDVLLGPKMLLYSSYCTVFYRAYHKEKCVNPLDPFKSVFTPQVHVLRHCLLFHPLCVLACGHFYYIMSVLVHSFTHSCVVCVLQHT